MEQVEPAPGEPKQLSPAQAGEGGHENKCPVAGLHCVGQCPDLVDGDHFALGRTLDAGAGDHAGVLHDELVGRRRGEDGVQQPVGLGHRRGTRLVDLEQPGVPAPHDSGRELPQLHAAECGQNVEAQQPLVQLSSSRPEPGPLRQPSPRVVSHRASASIRVDPGASGLIGYRQSRRSVSVSLRPEGPERHHLGTQRVAYPCLPASRCALPHTSGGPASRHLANSLPAVSAGSQGWKARPKSGPATQE